ncbi:MAG: ATP-binding protein [Candidatus Thorarchaeota archaeon]|nr:ATP-binding protein [Candidatus Thorarchaeota archaeon]
MSKNVSVLIALVHNDLVALVRDVFQEIDLVGDIDNISTMQESYDSTVMANYDIVVIDDSSVISVLSQKSLPSMPCHPQSNIILITDLANIPDSSSPYQVQNLIWLQNPLESSEELAAFRSQAEDIVQVIAERKNLLYRKLLDLIEASPIPAGIWVKNHKGRIYLERFNDPLIFRANELGYSLDDSSLKKMAQIGLEKIGEAIRLSLSDGVPRFLEEHHEYPQHDDVLTYWEIIPVGLNMVLVMTHYLTSAEALPSTRGLRYVFNAFPNPSFLFVYTQNEFILLRINPAAVVQRGFSDPEAMVGKTLHDVYSKMDRIVEMVTSTYQTGISNKVELVHPSYFDSTVTHTSFQTVRIGLDAVLVIETDMTPIRTVHQQLARQRDEMISFLNQFDHDLRNSLQVIASYVELLSDGSDSEIATGISSALEKIQHTLENSRELAQSGLVIGVKKFVDIEAIIRSVGEYCIPPEVSFTVESIPLVNCDQMKVSQAIENILMNAIEHGNATRIRVSSESTDDGIIIIISNNGTRIDPKQIDDILSGTYSSKGGTGGRGITITQRIIKAHGWRLVVDTDPETAFKIIIPQTETVT